METGTALALFTAAITAFLIAVGPAAKIVQKAVDFVRAYDKGDTWPKGLWILLSFVFGVVLALAFEFNFAAPVLKALPGLAATSDRLMGGWGQVLTGLGIGASASFWHERDDQASAGAKLALATAIASGVPASRKVTTTKGV